MNPSHCAAFERIWLFDEAYIVCAWNGKGRLSMTSDEQNKSAWRLRSKNMGTNAISAA
jgi:hypothetical protein